MANPLLIRWQLSPVAGRVFAHIWSDTTCTGSIALDREQAEWLRETWERSGGLSEGWPYGDED